MRAGVEPACLGGRQLRIYPRTMEQSAPRGGMDPGMVITCAVPGACAAIPLPDPLD